MVGHFLSRFIMDVFSEPFFNYILLASKEGFLKEVYMLQNTMGTIGLKKVQIISISTGELLTPTNLTKLYNYY